MPIDRTAVLTALQSQGVCPVFYHPDPEVALNVIRACARGGAPVIEFTNRGDFAVDLFADIARELAGPIRRSCWASARCSMRGRRRCT